MSTPSTRPGREPRAPSARDQEIYAAHKVHGKKQLELAAEYGMSRGRVSQIVKRVGAWRSDCGPHDGELKNDQRHRLERQLERERLEELYGQSLRLLSDFEKPATTHRKGERATAKGEKLDWWDQTQREQPNARVQALKAALRATEKLGELADRPPPPPASSPEQPGVSNDMLYWELERILGNAEKKGIVPRSNDAERIVYYVLRALGGEDLPAHNNQDVRQALAALGEALTVVSLGGRYISGKPRDLDPAALEALAPIAKLAKPPAPAEEVEFPPEVAAAVARCHEEARHYNEPALAERAAPSASLARENFPEFSAKPQSPYGDTAARSCPDEDLRDRHRRELEARRVEELRRAAELEEQRWGARQRAARAYVPPLDLGYQRSIPSAECLEQEAKERKKRLQSLVPVVTDASAARLPGMRWSDSE